MRDYPVLVITEKAERSLREGHVWVYDQEVIEVRGDCASGGIVDVRSRKDRYLGSGFVSDCSKIRVRLLTRNASDRIDDDFWRRRVGYALRYRLSVMPDEDFLCCRLIFGEADGFPGLTVDRFGDVLVAQVLSLAAETYKDVIFSALLKEMSDLGAPVRAFYERSDSPLRQKEGLAPFCGYFFGGTPDDGGVVEIVENGLRYAVDYREGQKTGFFLDQKYNRRAAATLARGKRVLDACTHTGSFALNCARAGAGHVTAVDVSADALACAARNAALNGLADRISFVEADIFDYLTEKVKTGRGPWDMIILDPPAFTRSRATLKAAYRGYKDLNYRAMKLLPRGGYLCSCSCSHFMTPALFEKMLGEAAADAAVTLRQIEARSQSPDHPILWGVPETEYLKCYLLQIT
ncbi:MAG: class I SAM-dependent rRNA methyltransferase [Clostridia bacterium]|nr:class I SAM-dependent rRNA methyltransferase [Clostridia bacterium]